MTKLVILQIVIKDDEGEQHSFTLNTGDVRDLPVRFFDVLDELLAYEVPAVKPCDLWHFPVMPVMPHHMEIVTPPPPYYVSYSSDAHEALQYESSNHTDRSFSRIMATT